MFVFHIFHYFSAPTAKKNQPSTTIDTMTDNRPTQVEQVGLLVLLFSGVICFGLL
jgi:hypothetical protein